VTKVDLDTGSPITQVKRIDQQIPTEFQLTAYPNPFTYSTSLNIIGLKPSHSKFYIKIYNILGKEVNDLSNQLKNNQIKWEGVDFENQHVAPGIYFVKVKRGSQIQKIVKINQNGGYYEITKNILLVISYHHTFRKRGCSC